MCMHFDPAITLQGTLGKLTVLLNIKVAIVIYCYFYWEVEFNSPPFNFGLAVVDSLTSRKWQIYVIEFLSLGLKTPCSFHLGLLEHCFLSPELLCEMLTTLRLAMWKIVHKGTPVTCPSWAQLSSHPRRGTSHKRKVTLHPQDQHIWHLNTTE